MHNCVVDKALSHCKCCQARRCKDAGCHISMPKGGSARFILAGTTYQTNHSFSSPLCDFLVFLCAKDDHVYVLELKSGSFSISDVVNQLQGGADVVSTITDGSRVRFYPVLVQAKGVSAIERKALASRKVLYGGRQYSVFVARCGSSLDYLKADP
jgi:hypothetical protein